MFNLFDEILDGMQEIAEIEGNQKFLDILDTYKKTGKLPSDIKKEQLNRGEHMLKLNEDMFDDIIEIEVPAVEVEPIEVQDMIPTGPDAGEDVGLTSLILDAISNCTGNIDRYNTIKVNLGNNTNLAVIIDEITANENYTLGKLQSMLKEISPNAENIKKAMDEVEIKLEGLR